MENKLILTISGICLMLVFSGVTVNAGQEELSTIVDIKSQNYSECPINISVHEAWDLLTDTGNGIQIPIDVRYEIEWEEGFIDTPYPECPIRYEYDEFAYNETFLQWFIVEYAGQELVIYCSGGHRSIAVSNVLCNAGFTGTVNNMLGGINTWKAERYPIRNNTAPEAPEINGPTEVKVDTPTDFIFSTTDLESDVVYYWIKWCEDSITEWDGPYESEEEIIFTNSWDQTGTFTIKAIARDFYGFESDMTEFEVTIPRSKAFNSNLLGLLFERFPYAFPIIGKFLGL